MTALARRFAGIAALALAAIASLAVSAEARQKRVALVIGNAAYENAGGLANPLNDARAVSQALVALDFDVVEVGDASQAEMLQALGAFSRKLTDADVALFYYAGHGLQVGASNYILPVDILVESERSLRYGAIDVADILRDMERSAAISVVVLDACRDNPFVEDLRRSLSGTRSLAVQRGLGRITPFGSGAIIAYSAAAGETASDGAGEHSPYTEALLEQIAAPNVEIGLMFRRVAGQVTRATRGEQRPELLIRLAQEFYLAGPPQAAAPLALAAAEPLRETPREEAVLQRNQPLSFRPARWGWLAAMDPREPARPAPAWTPPPRVEAEEAEPNDTFGAATRIGPNARFTHRISPRYDKDWVSFEIGHPGELRLAALDPPAEIDLIARLLDANGDVVVNWRRAPRPGGALEADFQIARPGFYRVELRDGGDDAESAEPIALDFAFLPQADLYEPNGDIGAATPISADFSADLNILPRYDQDWFRLTVDRPGELELLATRVPDNLAISFRVLDADAGVVQNWIRAARDGGDTFGTAALPRPGDYFIDLREHGDDAASIEPFEFSTRFTPDEDAQEPNGAPASAFPVDVSETLRLAIFPRYDQDWLRIEAVQPGQIELEITRPPKELDIHFRVLDANLSVVHNWIAAARKGGDTYGVVDLPRPGTYFIDIRDRGDDGFSIEPFDLSLAFTSQLDQFEPNNSLGAATPIAMGGEIPFNILPRYDQDWFRVTAADRGELAIEIDEAPEDLDIMFRVLDPSRAVIRNWVRAYRKGGLTEGFVDLPGPGVYYLDIRDSGDDARSIEHAVLKTRYTPAVDPLEPNDSFGAAAAAPIEGETVAHILPRYDQDWLKVKAATSGVLRIEVDDMPDDIDLMVRMLDADRSVVHNWTRSTKPGGVLSAEFAIKAPGTFWLDFRDNGDDGRSPEPFTIRRTFLR